MDAETFWLIALASIPVLLLGVGIAFISVVRRTTVRNGRPTKVTANGLGDIDYTDWVLLAAVVVVFGAPLWPLVLPSIALYLLVSPFLNRIYNWATGVSDERYER